MVTESSPLDNERSPDNFTPRPDPANKVVRRLMRLADLNPEDYSCEQAFVLLDRYAELVARGENAEELLPLVKRHLELCPGCEDEYDALLNILKNNPEE